MVLTKTNRSFLSPVSPRPRGGWFSRPLQGRLKGWRRATLQIRKPFELALWGLDRPAAGCAGQRSPQPTREIRGQASAPNAPTRCSALQANPRGGGDRSGDRLCSGSVFRKPFHRLTRSAWRRGWDSNPRYRCRYSGFRDRPNRPLWHPSGPARLLHDTPSTRNGRGSDQPSLRLGLVASRASRLRRPLTDSRTARPSRSRSRAGQPPTRRNDAPFRHG